MGFSVCSSTVRRQRSTVGVKGCVTIQDNVPLKGNGLTKFTRAQKWMSEMWRKIKYFNREIIQKMQKQILRLYFTIVVDKNVVKKEKESCNKCMKKSCNKGKG